MGNGFLEDLPDLGLDETAPRRKKRTKPEVTREAVVRWRVIKCPYRDCGSNDTYVTHTEKPIRHHKCRKCKRTFKSVEG